MRNYLYLLQIFGGGNPAINKAIQLYGNAENAVKAMLSGDTKCIPANIMERYKNASLAMSDTIIAFCNENHIDIITIDDKRYPERLRNIFNPPVLLFVDGDLSCLENHLAISVVGPRKTDAYIERLAMNICGGLAGVGCVLVSGFAKGIDRIACKAALDFNRATIAVLACGITVEYPAQTFPLREEVKKRGGAIISELLPDAGVTSDYFRTRNRIISGLTPATCIIGGNNHSGTMLTASHAFEQDRDLFFTIPSDTLNPNYSSVIKYLRDGAHPVYDFYDVLNEYYGEYEELLDGSKLDKTKLCYLPTRMKTQPETITSCESEINEIAEADTKIPVEPIAQPDTHDEDKAVTDKPVVTATVFPVPVIPAEKLHSDKDKYSVGKAEKKPSKTKSDKPRSEKITVKARTKSDAGNDKESTQFRLKIEQNGEQKYKPVNYADVTPASYMKKRPRSDSGHSAKVKAIAIMEENDRKKDLSEKPIDNIMNIADDSDMPAPEVFFDSDNFIRKKIIEVLSTSPMNIDNIIRCTGADYTQLTLALTEMELEGLIIGEAGGIYSIKK